MTDPWIDRDSVLSAATKVAVQIDDISLALLDTDQQSEIHAAARNDWPEIWLDCREVIEDLADRERAVAAARHDLIDVALESLGMQETYPELENRLKLERVEIERLADEVNHLELQQLASEISLKGSESVSHVKKLMRELEGEVTNSPFNSRPSQTSSKVRRKRSKKISTSADTVSQQIATMKSMLRERQSDLNVREQARVNVVQSISRRVDKLADANPQLVEMSTDLRSAYEVVVRDLGLGRVAESLRRAINAQTTVLYSTKWQPQTAAPNITADGGQGVVETEQMEQVWEYCNTLPRGSIGISGPRGAGKTILIDRILAKANHSGGMIGLSLYAPSQFDPREFILHAYAELCKLAGGSDEPEPIARERPRPEKAGVPQWVWWLSLSAVALGLAVILVVRNGNSNGHIALWISVLLGLIVATQASIQISRGPYAPLAALIAAAVIVAAVSWPLTRSGLRPLYIAALVTLGYAVVVGPILVRIFSDPHHLPEGWRSADWIIRRQLNAFPSIDHFWPLAAAAIGLLLSFFDFPSLLIGAATLSIVGTFLLRRAIIEYIIVRVARTATEFSARTATEAYGHRSDFEPSNTIDKEQRQSIESQASRRLIEIRHQQSISFDEGLKIGASLQMAAVSLSADANTSFGTTYARRVQTLPELVAEFRLFLGIVALERRVVIGIDELDKMSPQDALTFLNGIKSIFGVRNVCYLVSVSEDAVAEFERGGVAFRSAYDSAFDEAVRIHRSSYGTTVRLTAGQIIGMPRPFVQLAHMMSGGLPRELMRTLRQFQLEVPEAGASLDQVGPRLLEQQCAAKKRAVLFELSQVASDPTQTHAASQMLSMLMAAPDNHDLTLHLRDLSDRRRELTGDFSASRHLIDEYIAGLFIALVLREYCQQTMEQVEYGRLEVAEGRGSLDAISEAWALASVSPEASVAVVEYPRHWGPLVACLGASDEEARLLSRGPVVAWLGAT